MAVNKNFVVKNGLEVDTNLILADATTNSVGIGTTVPEYTLHVFEGSGIGATTVYVTGVTTSLQGLRVGVGGTVLTVVSSPGIGYSVGVGSSQPQYLLDVRSPVSTGQTAFYVQGDARITGDIDIEGDVSIDEINVRNLNVTGLSTFVGFATFQDNVYIAGITTLAGNGGITTTGGDFYVGGNFFSSGGIIVDTDLYIIGIATVGTLDVNNNANVDGNLLVTGLSTFVGLATFGGGIEVVTGVTTLGGYVDINNSVDISTNLNVSGLSTFVGFSTFQDYVFVQDGLVNAGVTTSNAYTIDGTQVISSARELQNIASLDATTTATIEAAIANAPNTFTDIKVTGLSTFVGLATFSGGIEVVSGVSTFAGFSTFQNDVYVAGVVTATSFYGDGSNLSGIATNLTATIGVGSESTFVGAGVTEIYFATTTGTNVSVVSAGTSATVTITPGVSLGLAIALGG
jgi:hypothetical protein